MWIVTHWAGRSQYHPHPSSHPSFWPIMDERQRQRLKQRHKDKDKDKDNDTKTQRHKNKMCSQYHPPSLASLILSNYGRTRREREFYCVRKRAWPRKCSNMWISDRAKKVIFDILTLFTVWDFVLLHNTWVTFLTNCADATLSSLFSFITIHHWKSTAAVDWVFIDPRGPLRIRSSVRPVRKI